MPVQTSYDNLAELPPVYTNTSWLHNFLINTHLAAPNRRMGAGLGFYGVATIPRDGVVHHASLHRHGEGVV